LVLIVFTKKLKIIWFKTLGLVPSPLHTTNYFFGRVLVCSTCAHSSRWRLHVILIMYNQQNDNEFLPNLIKKILTLKGKRRNNKR
jgi:hypothetical protein